MITMRCVVVLSMAALLAMGAMGCGGDDISAEEQGRSSQPGYHGYYEVGEGVEGEGYYSTSTGPFPSAIEWLEERAAMTDEEQSAADEEEKELQEKIKRSLDATPSLGAGFIVY